MLKNRSYKAYVIALFVVGIAVWIVGTSTSFQDCYHHHKHDDTYYGLHKSDTVFVSTTHRVQLNIFCGSEFSEANDKAIVAISTLIIAIFTTILALFTMNLARSTEVAANATKESADALMGAETSAFFVRVKQDTAGQILAINGLWDKSESMWGDKINAPGLAYYFTNIGRTVGVIRELSDQIIACDEFPKRPEYAPRKFPMPEIPIVAPQEDSDLFTCTLQGDFTVGHAVRFQKEKMDLWFYGYVRFDDSFKRRHRLNYRFRYHRGYGGFRLVDYREIIEAKSGENAAC